MRTVGRPTAIERRLRALANPQRSPILQRFFKTGPGEYGHGDQFLGLTTPQVRAVAREARNASLPELESLLDSRWHEARFLALVVLVDRYARADERTRAAIARLYLRRTDRVNSWDLVDTSAPGILGMHLLSRPRSVLRRLARSTSLWERRMAMVATLTFIRHGDYADTLDLAARLLGDGHDLIHKAVGWMLREVGKRDGDTLRRFLDRHAATMPRTTLRYATEQFVPEDRQRYLHLARATPRGTRPPQQERPPGGQHRIVRTRW